MKMVAYVLIALLSFAGTLVGVMAATGKLNKEALDRIKQGPAKPAAPAAREDDLGPVAHALAAREAELAKQEEALKTREQRVAQMEAGLEQLRTEVTEIQNQVKEALASEDTDRAQRLQDVATRIGKMKATNAAKVIENLPVDEAAAVMRLVKDKECAKILDSLKADKAAELLRALQEKKM